MSEKKKVLAEQRFRLSFYVVPYVGVKEKGKKQKRGEMAWRQEKY